MRPFRSGILGALLAIACIPGIDALPRMEERLRETLMSAILKWTPDLAPEATLELLLSDVRATALLGPSHEQAADALATSSQTASPDRTVGDVGATLVARDLGTDPEAWRKAMREWTANGNRPAPKPAAPARPELLAGTSMPAETLAIVRAAVADIEATAEVSESAAWAKVKTALAEREDAFVRRGYMLDNLRASLAAAHEPEMYAPVDASPAR